jgi:hypothetical protein
MSSMAALVLFAAAALPAPPATITADKAMANYRALIHGADHDPPGASVDCAQATDDQIVVCANRSKQTMRLPFRDERAEPGEVVRHLGEPASAMGALDTKPQCQYNCGGSPAPAIWGHLLNILKGEDPDD